MLICVSIIDSIRQNYANTIAILSLVYSIFILMYSLMLRSSNNQDIAREMNVAGTELLHLADQLQPYCNKNDINIDLYNIFSDKYEEILLKNKINPKKIDYEVMKIDFREYYNFKTKDVFLLLLSIT